MLYLAIFHTFAMFAAYVKFPELLAPFTLILVMFETFYWPYPLIEKVEEEK